MLAGLTQAFTGEFDAVGIVEQTVENGVGVGRIADQLMPMRRGDLAGNDGGAAAVAILDDLEQIMAGAGVEWSKAEVVEDQQIDGAESADHPAVPPFGAGEREFCEEFGGALIEHGPVIATCLEQCPEFRV